MLSHPETMWNRFQGVNLKDVAGNFRKHATDFASEVVKQVSFLGPGFLANTIYLPLSKFQIVRVFFVKMLLTFTMLKPLSTVC